jgi:phosphatidylglycerol:prolipoprotein diacylglycerol transferase
MYPVLFKIGPFSVHAYGFAIATAFLVGILISLHYAKKEGIKADQILDLAVYVIIAAIVGSRFLYVIGQWHEYQDNLLEIFMVQRGGLVFLGGLFLVLLVVVWHAKRKGIPVLKLLDVVSPGTLVGYAITRIGCFFNGCCFGQPTELPCGMVFPPGSLAHAYFPGQHIHPTQLYASASMLLAFIILLLIYRRKRFDGHVFYWGLILYSVYRFLVEFIRFSPIHWLGLTPSQWMVIPLAGWAIYALLIKQRRLQQ